MDGETLNGSLFKGSIKGGTPQLFPTRDMLSDKARWPRGFTPERQAEVADALGHYRSSRVARDKVHRDKRLNGTTLSQQGQRESGQIEAVRTVARSTVPVEHLAGLRGKFRVVPPSELNGAVASGQYDETHGVQIAGGAHRGPTPIHEIGHHVSSHILGTEHSAYEHPEQMGAEEAYAENYAEEHFRDRRGRPLSTPRADPSSWTRGGQRGGRYGGFHEGWDEERKGSPAAARRAALPEKRPPGLPSGHVTGQMPLLDHVSTQGADGRTTVDWDYTHDSGLKSRRH